MVFRRLRWSNLIVLFCGLTLTGPVLAKSLEDRLAGFAGAGGLIRDFNVKQGGQVSGVVSLGSPARIPDFFGPVIEKLAIRGADFPVTSTVPGFSYVFDPQLQVIERSAQMGPVFVERVETVGKGRFELGASFLFASLEEVNGGGFGGTDVLFARNKQITVNGQDVIPLASTTVESLRLEYYWTNASFTYGLTDKWDVNVLLPVVYTTMRARGFQQFPLLAADTLQQTGSICQVQANGDCPSTFDARADGSAFGVGDLLVRTKYQLPNAGPVSLAGALSLRLPTGSVEDFQGLGDYTITPTGVAQLPIGKHALHATLGFEVNADDLTRTRARYSLGGSIQVLDQLALLIDVLGSSSLADDKFEVASIGAPVNGVTFEGTTANTTKLAVPRSDLIDLATGLKVALGQHGAFYVGAIVPLTNDGIRAQVIPTGGIQIGF